MLTINYLDSSFCYHVLFLFFQLFFLVIPPTTSTPRVPRVLKNLQIDMACKYYYFNVLTLIA